MKKIFSMGLLASVDAGKTTLSEGLLYTGKSLKTMGNVDKGTVMLDMYDIERQRGITVFSKEADFTYNDSHIFLIDTPGHEALLEQVELSLAAIDVAVILFDETKGITPHSRRLYQLADERNIPVVFFVNKMDRSTDSGEKIIREITDFLPKALLFKGIMPEDEEDLAQLDESLMNEYFKNGKLSREDISRAFMEGEFVPVITGAAINLSGIKALLDTITTYFNPIKNSESSDFKGQIYKVLFDERGTGLCFVKVKSGKISVKENLYIGEQREKIQEIRIYRGAEYIEIKTAQAGMNIVLVGIKNGKIGDFLYGEAPSYFKEDDSDFLVEKEIAKEPFANISQRYSFAPDVGVLEDRGISFLKVREAFNLLGRESPNLQPKFLDATNEIELSLEGELEEEILTYRLRERFAIEGKLKKIKMKRFETILGELSGHSPGYVGSELAKNIRNIDCRDRINPQGIILKLLPKERLIPPEFRIYENLKGKKQDIGLKAMEILKADMPKGLLSQEELTGFDVILEDITVNSTDIDTSILGEYVNKAFINALWQGYEKNELVVLEPFSEFEIKCEEEAFGQVISFLEKNRIQWKSDSEKESLVKPENTKNQEFSICGRAVREKTPEIMDFIRKNLKKGVFYRGKIRYDIAMDNGGKTDHLTNHENMKELFDVFKEDEKNIKSFIKELAGSVPRNQRKLNERERFRQDRELEKIFLRTYGKSKRDEALRRRQVSHNMPVEEYKAKIDRNQGKTQLYILDGYNLIFSWGEIKTLAKENMDAARELLLDIMENYQGYSGHRILAVFDGYRVKGNPGENTTRGGVNIVYTREGETADRFIEKTVYRWSNDFNITVVTSDMAVQMAALGDGALRKSAREFESQVMESLEEIRKKLGEING